MNLCKWHVRERSNLEGDRWSFERWQFLLLHPALMFAFFQQQKGKCVQEGGEGGGRVVVTLAFNRNSFSLAMEPNQICYIGFFWGMRGVESKEIDRVKTLFQADKSEIMAPTQGWINSHSSKSPGAVHLLFSKHKKTHIWIGCLITRLHITYEGLLSKVHS